MAEDELDTPPFLRELFPRLEHLRVGETAMDPEALLALRLPPSLRICALCTGKERENKKIREVLASRGYEEFTHPAGA